MKYNVFLLPGELPDFYGKGRRLVLVDVLRACTSLAVALNAGVERIIPAPSVEGAKALRGALDREYTLLAGEQDGMKLPGFDLGNSPRDFLDPTLSGKTLVYTSTNGARLMTELVDASEQLLLSFVNLPSVAASLQAFAEEEVNVVCAGQRGAFALEDAVCAGMLGEALASNGAELIKNDGAQAALVLYQAHRDDLRGCLRRSDHGVFLAGHGMEEDLDEAARVGSVSLVPVVRQGRITALREPWSRS